MTRAEATTVTMSPRPLREHEGLLPPWPGRQVGPLHVRQGPSGGSEPALFVHGLGGSAMNWTDLMGALGDVLEGLHERRHERLVAVDRNDHRQHRGPRGLAGIATDAIGRA